MKDGVITDLVVVRCDSADPVMFKYDLQEFCESVKDEVWKLV